MATLTRERPSLHSSPTHTRNSSSAAAKNYNDSQPSPAASPYSLSNEDMNQLTEEFDNDQDDEMTTSGRTYEELVNASLEQQPRKQSAAVGQQQQQQQQSRNSMMSEETEESEEVPPSKKYGGGRQSVGFMLGRNSLSNWSTIGGGIDEDDNDIPSSVHMETMNTGRKSNVSRHSLGRRMSSETPNIMNASHVNVSQRRSNQVHNSSRGGQRSNSNARLSRPSHKMVATTGGGRRSNSLNLSHISSSSSSGMEVSGEDMLGDSWSPIRTSLENSFAKSVANGLTLSPNKANEMDLTLSPNKSRSSIGQKRSGSLSPIRGRSSNSLSPKKLSPKKTTMSKSPTRRSLSPKKSPIKSKSSVRSPVRSPLGDISPNRSPARDGRTKSPKRNTATSPKRGSASMALTKEKALSPNGTYSLKEAEGTLPTATATADAESCNSSNMSVSSGSQTTT
ncbi:hypothetical protein ACHAXR_002953, partial [Thalassiosira sp. AJA248-18]